MSKSRDPYMDAIIKTNEHVNKSNQIVANAIAELASRVLPAKEYKQFMEEFIESFNKITEDEDGH